MRGTKQRQALRARGSRRSDTAATDLDVTVHRKRRRALDETANLGAGEVLCDGSELLDVDVGAEDIVELHLGRVDVEDLEPAVLVRERDLHVDLEPARPEEGLVNHVKPVRHADDENVVQLVDTVHLKEGAKGGGRQPVSATGKGPDPRGAQPHLGQQLVDDRVADAGATAGRATLLADGVELVKDDDVQARVVPLGLILQEGGGGRGGGRGVLDVSLVTYRARHGTSDRNRPPSPRPQTACGCSPRTRRQTC